jgi:hypothetical protein
MSQPVAARTQIPNAAGAPVGPAPVTPADYRRSFGEDLSRVLDLGTWHSGDLGREYARIEREVVEAVRHESAFRRGIRERVFPALVDPTTAPKGGGVYQASLDLIARVHRGLLFNGGVEACDGTVHVHDTLPLTIYQIGIGLVSYRGDQGTWSQQLFRRDLRLRSEDPIAEAVELLQRRAARGALNHPADSDQMGELARKTLMAYGERAVLLRRSKAVWLMGHGNPAPYEMLNGANCFQMAAASVRVLREMIEKHQKFVFVASEPRERLLLTIGEALRPMEYVIVGTLKDRLDNWFAQERFTFSAGEATDWDGEQLKPGQLLPRFRDEVASKVVVGVYRASAVAPAQVFYAHVDHADLAAHIVLADSALQENRGFPLLIDLAHHVCAAVFGGTLRSLTDAAYAAAGVPCRYQSERASRDH